MEIKELKRLFKDEEGSISILVIGLFLLTIAVIMTMTNISTVFLAKKSLTQATEAAAQYSLGNLDAKAYYKGEFSNVTLLQNILGVGPEDPGIPIDCEKSPRDVGKAMSDWVDGGDTLFRSELREISIDQILCDGFSMIVKSSATVELPFQFPIFGIKNSHITSRVQATNERKGGLYIFGMRIG